MIQQATKENVNELKDIEDSLFDKNNYPLSKSSFYNFIKKQNLYIYKVDNQIAGYIVLINYKKSIRIYSLGIKKEFQGKGISKEIIKFVIEKLKNDLNIILEVRVDNYKAIKLYESLGFKILKKLDNYYDDVDGYKMLHS